MPVSIEQVAQVIERIAPKSWAEEWDNVGLLVGEGAAQIKRLLLTLDGTSAVVAEAEACGAQLIVSHHPLLFRGLKNLREDNREARIPLSLIRSGIAYYAAHTNLDQSVLSSSWTIGRALGLKQMELLAPVAWESWLKLIVFVPQTHAETVRQALASVGVGTVNSPSYSLTTSNYTECFFQAPGEGLFRPLLGAKPALGRLGELTRVEEVKLEGIVTEGRVDRALRILKKVHPYEEPAFDLIPLQNRGSSRGYGVVGYLTEPLQAEELWAQIQELFQTGTWARAETASRDKSGNNPEKSPYPAGMRLAAAPSKLIRKVALVNGSGGDFIAKALHKGADLYISGDIGHHHVLDALEGGMAVADIGHFLSEIPMVYSLADYLRAEKCLKNLEIIISSQSKAPWSV
jgi:dinuclear metal center YbgI/SA1388 family protein